MMRKLLTDADNCALFSCVNKARLELVRWFEWPDRVTSPEAAKDYIAEIQAGSRIKLWWLIYDNGIPIGGVQLRLRDGGESVSLPYWLVPSAQGKGIATQAVRESIAVAKAIGFWKAKFSIALDNHRSAALAARVGFHPVGEPKDTPFRGGVQRAQAFELFL